MNEDALVGPQVAEVKQHHVGCDVVDRQGGGLLEAHALRDEEGVVRWCHHHLLPQPEAVQHHHLIADLEQRLREKKAQLLAELFPPAALVEMGTFDNITVRKISNKCVNKSPGDDDQHQPSNVGVVKRFPMATVKRKRPLLREACAGKWDDGA